MPISEMVRPAKGNLLSPRVLPIWATKTGRYLAWLAGCFLVCVLGIVLWIGIRGFAAFEHLSNLQTTIAALSLSTTAHSSDDPAAIATAAEDTRAARDLTSDPIWRAAEHTPWMGPQLTAFRTVASSSNQLVEGTLIPLIGAASKDGFESLSPKDGRFDLGAIEKLSGPAQTASDNASQAFEAVKAIDRTPLIRSVESAVARAADQFEEAAVATDALSRATTLLPKMLGGGEPRSYLLLVQNNAEWRSLGGITGTAILVTTDQGHVSLVRADSATSLSRGIGSPIADLPGELKTVYETRPARWFHNLTEIPDFTIDGPLARDMYRQQTGTEVDGVLAVDPVVLSYLLKATGPVTLPDGSTLTSDNAVPVLLNEVYTRFPAPADQDAFFSAATGAIFSALLGGQGATQALLVELARGVEEHRLFLWSAQADEQAVLRDSTLAGNLPSTDAQTARIGVYLNDGTGSKMSYYVKPDVSLLWGQCGTAEQSSERELALKVTLTSEAPADAASLLPPYITGNGAYGTAPGAVTTVSNVFMPPAWEVVSIATSNGLNPASATVGGRQVLTFDSTIAPQVSATYSVIIRASSTVRQAEAWVTPTADSRIFPIVTAECETTNVASLQ